MNVTIRIGPALSGVDRIEAVLAGIRQPVRVEYCVWNGKDAFLVRFSRPVITNWQGAERLCHASGMARVEPIEESGNYIYRFFPGE